MYRHPALRSLSRDHHRVLQLARALQPDATAALRALITEDDGDLTAAVTRAFIDDIDPHLRAEEEVLVPALEHRAPAVAGLATELQIQHAALRSAFVTIQLASDPLRALATFGLLLAKHVRWEERTLFPAIQNELGDAGLAALSAALA